MRIETVALGYSLKEVVLLQVAPVGLDVLSSVGDGRLAAASPVVSIEPLRRKFHRPVTVTVPIVGGELQASPKLRGRASSETASELRLMCSVSGDSYSS